jgi:hypothetical protein
VSQAQVDQFAASLILEISHDETLRGHLIAVALDDEQCEHGRRLIAEKKVDALIILFDSPAGTLAAMHSIWPTDELADQLTVAVERAALRLGRQARCASKEPS